MGRDGERREKPSVEIINTIWLRTQTHLLKDVQVNGEPSTFNREAQMESRPKLKRDGHTRELASGISFTVG